MKYFFYEIQLFITGGCAKNMKLLDNEEEMSEYTLVEGFRQPESKRTSKEESHATIPA